MGRPKGSKNKVKAATLDINQLAQRYANLFIATQHIGPAERLAQLILEKIIANRKRLEVRYGKE